MCFYGVSVGHLKVTHGKVCEENHRISNVYTYTVFLTLMADIDYIYMNYGLLVTMF